SCQVPPAGTLTVAKVPGGRPELPRGRYWTVTEAADGDGLWIHKAVCQNELASPWARPTDGRNKSVPANPANVGKVTNSVTATAIASARSERHMFSPPFGQSRWALAGWLGGYAYVFAK